MESDDGLFAGLDVDGDSEFALAVDPLTRILAEAEAPAASHVSPRPQLPELSPRGVDSSSMVGDYYSSDYPLPGSSLLSETATVAGATAGSLGSAGTGTGAAAAVASPEQPLDGYMEQKQSDRRRRASPLLELWNGVNSTVNGTPVRVFLLVLGVLVFAILQPAIRSRLAAATSSDAAVASSTLPVSTTPVSGSLLPRHRPTPFVAFSTDAGTGAGSTAAAATAVGTGTRAGSLFVVGDSARRTPGGHTGAGAAASGADRAAAGAGADSGSGSGSSSGSGAGASHVFSVDDVPVVRSLEALFHINSVVGKDSRAESNRRTESTKPAPPAPPASAPAISVVSAHASKPPTPSAPVFTRLSTAAGSSSGTASAGPNTGTGAGAAPPPPPGSGPAAARARDRLLAALLSPTRPIIDIPVAATTAAAAAGGAAAAAAARDRTATAATSAAAEVALVRAARARARALARGDESTPRIPLPPPPPLPPGPVSPLAQWSAAMATSRLSLPAQPQLQGPAARGPAAAAVALAARAAAAAGAAPAAVANSGSSSRSGTSAMGQGGYGLFGGPGPASLDEFVIRSTDTANDNGSTDSRGAPTGDGAVGSSALESGGIVVYETDGHGRVIRPAAPAPALAHSSAPVLTPADARASLSPTPAPTPAASTRPSAEGAAAQRGSLTGTGASTGVGEAAAGGKTAGADTGAKEEAVEEEDEGGSDSDAATAAAATG
jgi:hypothetical protein